MNGHVREVGFVLWLKKATSITKCDVIVVLSGELKKDTSFLRDAKCIGNK